LYDLRILRRRLELLEARLEKSVSNLKLKGEGSDMLRSYTNAIGQIRYVICALEALEIKLENVITMNTVTQDLVVVREALKELSQRIRGLPEVSAILDEMGDSVSDVIADTPVTLDTHTVTVSRETAKKILEEAEKIAEIKRGKLETVPQ
jgi:division protein CdvB (Snf7/Vps24/ESCRT-III family)